MDQSQQLNNSNLKIDHHVELVENLIKLATEEEKKKIISLI